MKSKKFTTLINQIDQLGPRERVDKDVMTEFVSKVCILIHIICTHIYVC